MIGNFRTIGNIIMFIPDNNIKNMIKLIKSSFYNEKKTKKELCNFIINTKQLSFGKYCKQFEKDFANWQGAKYCVFFNSGSSANLAIIQALLNLGKIKKGDKIGFSSLTWATNVMPIIQLGLNPVPLDVNLYTLNVSVEKLKEIHEKNNLKALFITNLLGLCDKIDEIKDYCDKNKIILLEDNCESMGTIYKGEKLGNYGEMSSFSTYVGHHMSTVEGGMICTNNKEFYKMLVIVRAHGWDRNMEKNEQEKIRKENNIENNLHSSYAFYNLGYNFRPSEFNGFLGCTQIPYLDEIVELREKNFKTFVKLINSNPNLENIEYKHIDLVSSFSIPIICKSKEILNKYIKLFQENNIEIRPIVGGDITNQIFWKNLYGNEFLNENARYIHENGFYFGNSPEYTNKEINLLCSLLK
ncbi:DegT/DnrJ/EryC1/StrS aminotransferase [Candidatus Gracilibacteria bacterium]|nr:MAG: DegT/DnrJ/EryC1/StrS aminotransferase [Candidatus Gracilibacteria bacterium]PIE85606.1 MAG: DegT/DnrJ/EryC1/StrS aminotransferase [Candidatus Gracilibacteria bacterium]